MGKVCVEWREQVEKQRTIGWRREIQSLADAVMPHLDAAYNLARWLMRDDHEAQDAVQDACLRAIRFFSGFRGGDGRGWLLSIVRNTCYSRMRSGRVRQGDSEFDEQMHGIDDEAANPEILLLRSRDEAALRRALDLDAARVSRGDRDADSRGCRTRKSPRWRKCRSAR